MDCPHCGYLFGPLERECPKCARMAPASPTGPAGSPDVGTPLTDQTFKICPRCQQPAPMNAVGCGRCGYPAAAPPIPPIAAPRSRGWGTPAAVSVTFIVLFAAFFLFRSVILGSGGGSGLTLLKTGPQSQASGLASIDSQQIDQRLSLASANTGGDLEVSLAWNSLSDLDLQVREPSGTIISAAAPRSPSGGVQDVDANSTLLNEEGMQRARDGQIPGQENVIPLPEILIDPDKNAALPAGVSHFLSNIPDGPGQFATRFTRTPIEHTYYENAPRGVYSVFAHCYSWREPNATPLPFTVEVRTHGRVFYRTTGAIGPRSFVADGAVPILVCQFRMR